MPKSNIVMINRQLEKVIPFFLEETSKDFEKLKVHISNKNASEISHIAHSLKGDCGSYGFSELSLIAEQLENAAKSRDFDQADYFVSKMEFYLKNVSIQFEQVA